MASGTMTTNEINDWLTTMYRTIWLTIDGHKVQFWLCDGKWDYGFEWPLPKPVSRYMKIYTKISDHLRWVNSLERGPNGPVWGDLTGDALLQQLLEDNETNH